MYIYCDANVLRTFFLYCKCIIRTCWNTPRGVILKVASIRKNLSSSSMCCRIREIHLAEEKMQLQKLSAICISLKNAPRSRCKDLPILSKMNGFPNSRRISSAFVGAFPYFARRHSSSVLFISENVCGNNPLQRTSVCHLINLNFKF